MPALFYFHIPSAAGSSVIAEIGRHFAESEILTDGGNLTMPFLEACGEERLRDAGFLHGQPGAGAAAYLQGIADAILLLREPMDRMIAHYQDMLRDPNMPWHRAAAELGFRDFIETYPHFLAFQTISPRDRHQPRRAVGPHLRLPAGGRALSRRNIPARYR